MRTSTIRTRLSDVAWWMRLLCRNIGTRAKKKDREVGKFFQGRYRTVRILDEESLLACSAYVDLDLIRAAMAETIELSDFTSAQRRIESIQALSKDPSIESASLRDSFLPPLTIDERNDPIGRCASRSGKRCSDKGFLSLSTLDYLELPDETARITRADKAGATAMDLPPIFERLKLDVGYWKLLVKDFGRLFSLVADAPTNVYKMRSLISKRRFILKRLDRQLAATS